MKPNRLLPAFTLLFLSQPRFVQANNLKIDNVELIKPAETNNHIVIRCDVSWDNSFRDDINWDATWLFVKFQLNGGPWQHVSLSGQAEDHTIPQGAELEIGFTDGTAVGAFIFRNAPGSGNVDWRGIELAWDSRADELPEKAELRVKVFGIEMVYIPQGSFEVGDASADLLDSHFFDGEDSASSYTVDFRGNITLGPEGLNWVPNTVDATIGSGLPLGTTHAEFPTGYRAFYCMKYEVSQEQYADFLNTLTPVQAEQRAPTSTFGRYTIQGTHPEFTAEAGARACNFLAWRDGAAFADWAGLRPMTELEFEKICRGPESPVPGEFAWGSTVVHGEPMTIVNDGTDDAAIIGAGEGNAVYFNTSTVFNGPVRVGIFATANSTRAQAGASYYGVMEMSGSMTERCITLGNNSGRNFRGTHGDGELSSTGLANVPSWPAIASLSTSVGVGSRGGSFLSLAPTLRVSFRSGAGDSVAQRGQTLGIRAVRTSKTE